MDVDYFEKCSENWEVTARSKVIAGIFTKELIPHDSASILDLGCGTGILCSSFRENIPEARVIYIDKALGMIKRLKDKYKVERILRAEGENLPLKENQLDVAIIYNSFPHFWSRERTISECYRVLKSGGRLIIGHSATPEEINRLHREIGGEVADHSLPQKEAFIDLFRNSGFYNIEYFVNDYFYIIGFK